jgi:hypothetical protein
VRFVAAVVACAAVAVATAAADTGKLLDQPL